MRMNLRMRTNIQSAHAVNEPTQDTYDFVTVAAVAKFPPGERVHASPGLAKKTRSLVPWHAVRQG